jgi:hypothetical protein
MKASVHSFLHRGSGDLFEICAGHPSDHGLDRPRNADCVRAAEMRMHRRSRAVVIRKAVNGYE